MPVLASFLERPCACTQILGLSLPALYKLSRGLLDDLLKFETKVPKVHEPQGQRLITSYRFAPELARLARVLPP